MSMRLMRARRVLTAGLLRHDHGKRRLARRHATLSVADPSQTFTGKLVNGAFALPETLQVNAVRETTSNGVYAPVGGTAAPTPLLAWAAPASNEQVTVGFKQPVKAGDALRTGQYGKTLTFTLSTTTP
jgi:hypothetical protein